MAEPIHFLTPSKLPFIYELHLLLVLLITCVIMAQLAKSLKFMESLFSKLDKMRSKNLSEILALESHPFVVFNL